ncbi:MAG: hypothetical protein ACTSVL_10720 [Promethearchaeota archaeon]
MIYDLLNLLNTRRFAELIPWAQDSLQNSSDRLKKEEIDLLTAISNQKINDIIKIVEQQKYLSDQEASYGIILDLLKKNQKGIQAQWAFKQKFDEDSSFINLVIDKEILVCQEKAEEKTDSINSNSNIKRRSIDERLQRWKSNLINSNSLWVGKKQYLIKGIQSVSNLTDVLRKSGIQERYLKYYKYEKIANFIEALTIQLQNLFSLNRIGVIIFHNDLYLIKWVQYLNEEQLITGKSSKKTGVMMLDDFGVKIGIQLKENLELGNLVVFKNENRNQNEKTSDFTTLMSLNQGFFHRSAKKIENDQYNFKNSEKYRAFINQINDRIETGILLLSKKLPEIMENSEDLDLYVKISLERIEGMTSLNQRLNVLRDLLRLNKNPDNFQAIIKKLEENYIKFMKQQIELANIEDIPSILNMMADLNLFQENLPVLVHTIVYMFEKVYASTDLIINSLKTLEDRWSIPFELERHLDQPKLIALTNKIRTLLQNLNINEVFSYITNFLEENPSFQIKNIYSLMLKVFMEIYQYRGKSAQDTLTNIQFLNFFQSFCVMIKENTPGFSQRDLQEFLKIFHEDLHILVNDLDFLTFLDGITVKFIEIINSFETSLISNIEKHKLFLEIVKNAPLVSFTKKKLLISSEIFNFFTQVQTIASHQDVVLLFIERYFFYFRQGGYQFKIDSVLFHEATDLSEKIKNWIDHMQIHPVLLLPIKNRIKELLSQWYLSRELPELDYTDHLHLINIWVSFAGFNDVLGKIKDHLEIKDFIWSAGTNDLGEFRKKYLNFSDSIFQNSSNIFYDECLSFLQKPFNSITQFNFNLQIFNWVKGDFNKFNFSFAQFKKILSAFLAGYSQKLILNIQDGNQISFERFLTCIKEDWLFISPLMFQSIFQNLILTHNQDRNEGIRFNSRIDMLKLSKNFFSIILKKYDFHKNARQEFFQGSIQAIPKETLNTFIENINTQIITIFEKCQDWIVITSIKNYISEKDTIEPVKNIFLEAISLFNHQEFLKIIRDFSNHIFYNQAMLSQNKVKIFSMLTRIYLKKSFAELYPELLNQLDFLQKFSEIENTYFNLSKNIKKVKVIAKNLKDLIDKYPDFHLPQMYYGAIMLIENRIDDSIVAFEDILNSGTFFNNKISFYHNLLIAYLNTNQMEKVIHLVQKLPVGIKTDSRISKIIEGIERESNISLLQH